MCVFFCFSISVWVAAFVLRTPRRVFILSESRAFVFERKTSTMTRTMTTTTTKPCLSYICLIRCNCIAAYYHLFKYIHQESMCQIRLINKHAHVFLNWNRSIRNRSILVLFSCILVCCIFLVGYLLFFPLINWANCMPILQPSIIMMPLDCAQLTDKIPSLKRITSKWSRTFSLTRHPSYRMLVYCINIVYFVLIKKLICRQNG